MSTPAGLRDLGAYGVWTFEFEEQPAAQMRDAVQELEERGWRALWVPELLGREAFSHAGYLLSCTKQLHVINGIAQIWGRQPEWAHGASLLLADAYPDRYVLGLGFGGHERPGTTPLAAMNRYLDELDAIKTANPAPVVPAPRILAAYGPKMLALARDRSAGAHCYKVTVAKFRRLGYSEEDLARGGSERFVDDLVFWGDVDTIVGKLQEHLDAGADHVGVQVIGAASGQSAMPYWRLLGEALLPGR